MTDAELDEIENWANAEAATRRPGYSDETLRNNAYDVWARSKSGTYLLAMIAELRAHRKAANGMATDLKRFDGYTKGPWEFRQNAKRWLLWGRWGSRPIVLDSWKGDWRCRNAELDVMVPFDPEHPDMRLIEAAPDLLAAVVAHRAAMPVWEALIYICESPGGIIDLLERLDHKDGRFIGKVQAAREKLKELRR